MTLPGVDSVANVCGQCHVTQWNLFNESPHREAFAENGLPACVTCHQNHEIKQPTDAMLGVEDPAPCGTCHDKGSAGYDRPHNPETIFSLPGSYPHAAHSQSRDDPEARFGNGPQRL